MDIETLRDYCLLIKGSEECLPFDDVTLVYKIMGNKKYWNTLFPNRDMSDAEIESWILHSVDEVIKKLPGSSLLKYGEIKKTE